MPEELTYAVLIPIHKPNEFLNEALASVIDDVDTNMPIYLILHKPNLQLQYFISSSCFFERLTLLESHAETLGGCLNDALSQIKEDFVFRMDSDDIWLKGRFITQTKYLKKYPDVAVIGGGINVLNTLLASSHTLRVKTLTKLRIWDFLKDCPVKHPTVLYNRQKIILAGGYRPTLRATEDYDLWIRVISRYQIVLVPEILISYRLHAESQSLKFESEQIAETTLIRETLACSLSRITKCHSTHGLQSKKSCRTRMKITHLFHKVFSRTVIEVEGV